MHIFYIVLFSISVFGKPGAGKPGDSPDNYEWARNLSVQSWYLSTSQSSSQPSGESPSPQTINSSLLQPKNSPLKSLAKKQNREKFQYRKWTIGAAKMRSSILCVRDYLSIFYIGIFHGSSVLASPFSGRLLPAANQNSSISTMQFPRFSFHFIR